MAPSRRGEKQERAGVETVQDEFMKNSPGPLSADAQGAPWTPQAKHQLVHNRYPGNTG